MAKDGVNFKMDIKELADLMKAVEKDFAKREKALYNPVRRSLDPIRKDMNANAPVEHGILNKSHRVSRVKGSKGKDKTAARVGPSTGIGKIEGARTRLAGWRAHFAEFGTKHHRGTGYLGAAISLHWPNIQNKLAEELAKEFKVRLRRFNRKKK